MDVHPTKNCINRYWSIPTFVYCLNLYFDVYLWGKQFMLHPSSSTTDKQVFSSSSCPCLKPDPMPWRTSSIKPAAKLGLHAATQQIWLVVSTPLKNIRQLGWVFPIYGKIKNVPKHQPEIFWNKYFRTLWMGITGITKFGCFIRENPTSHLLFSDTKSLGRWHSPRGTHKATNKRTYLGRVLYWRHSKVGFLRYH